MIDKVFLPFALILITYGLKLFIDQQVDKRIAIKSACELPIDIIFLSISLLIAVIVSNTSNRSEGLLSMLMNFALAIFIVFLSKKSASIYHNGSSKIWGWLFALNMFLSILSLFISINMLGPDTKNSVNNSTHTKSSNGN
jgi:hypothetical protein